MGPEMVGNFVGAMGHRGHHRDTNDIKVFIERYFIDSLIDEDDFMLGRSKCRNGDTAQSRKPEGSHLLLGEFQARIRILWGNQQDAHCPLPFQPLHCLSRGVCESYALLGCGGLHTTVASIGKFYTSGTKSLAPPTTLKLFRTVRRAGHDGGAYSG